TKGNKNQVFNEISHLLKKIGDDNPKIEITCVKGLITVKTNFNTFTVIRKLRNLLIDQPWTFRTTLKFRPIEKLVNADLKQILKASIDLSLKIGEKEKFMIQINKRLTNIERQDIINSVASEIKHKMDLINPDKILLIEIVGNKARIGVDKKR
ncbi:THUMP domain-containing protein, partial [Candidatus Bathyarchaeota archaeon]|nr:THUMP domain-containing protein [Candidatus Bathyarchaeota archaeon]